jgi:hypothetical protein
VRQSSAGRIRREYSGRTDPVAEKCWHEFWRAPGRCPRLSWLASGRIPARLVVVIAIMVDRRGKRPGCGLISLDFAIRLRLMRATCADRQAGPRLYPFSSPPYRPYCRAAPVGLEKDGPQFSRDFAIVC